MEGENFVSLKGQVNYPNLRTVGENNTSLFKGKLVIPIKDKKQYLKIAAWGAIAEGLNEVNQSEFVHIHGHIEERSYNGACSCCKNEEKKYWTEVVVDNFVVLA